MAGATISVVNGRAVWSDGIDAGPVYKIGSSKLPCCACLLSNVSSLRDNACTCRCHDIPRAWGGYQLRSEP